MAGKYKLSDVYDFVNKGSEMQDAEKVLEMLMANMKIPIERDPTDGYILQNWKDDPDVDDNLLQAALNSVGFELDDDDDMDRSEIDRSYAADAGIDLDNKPEVAVVTTDSIDPDEEETLFKAIQAMRPDQRAGFLKRLNAGEDIMGDMSNENRRDLGLEGASNEQLRSVNSGSALAKLIGSLKF